jgi:tryptophanyl-tRNA synthetase
VAANSFAPAAELKKTVRRITTDSTPVEAPKDPDSSSVFQLLAHFADPATTAEVRAKLEAGGFGWGDLKNALYEALVSSLGPMQERYQQLMRPDSELDDLLRMGAEKARKRARPVLAGVREAIGIAGPAIRQG